MKRLLLVFILCLVSHPVFLYSQSTFIRSLTLYTPNSKTAPHPPSGGYIHATAKSLGGTIYAAFTRLDSSGQPVQTTRTGTGIGGNGYPVDLVRLTGGGYAVAYRALGSTLFYTLDSMGMPLTCKKGGEQDYIEELEPAPDGGFLAVGFCPNARGLAVAGLLMKFDAQGDTLWTRTYDLDTTGVDFFDAAALPSGGFIIVGRMDGYAGLVKVSAHGQTEWTKQYRVTNGSQLWPKKLVYNGDDQILVGAYSLSGSYASAVAFDTLGNFQWGNRITNRTNFTFRRALLTPDGDMVLAGQMVEFVGASTFRYGVSLHVTQTGNFTWLHQHLFSNTFYLSDVERVPSGGYFWTGSNYSQTLLYKTTATDSIEGACGPVSLNFITAPILLDTTPISPVVVVQTELVNLNLTTFTSSATSAIACAAVAVTDGLPALTTSVLPQPMRSTARILLSAGILADDAQLHITDLSGRQLSLPVTRLPDGWEIQRGGLPAGIYAYQVLQGGQRVASGKLWVAD
jgi:hypothetical protein